MLNGVEIKDAVLPKTSTNASVIVESQLGSKIIENINNVESKVVGVVNKDVEFENAVQSPKTFMYILENIPNFTRTKAYKNLLQANFAGDIGDYTPEEFKEKIYQTIGQKDLKAQKDKIDIAIKLEAKRQDPEAFLCILDNYFPDQSSNAYKKNCRPYKD